MDSLMKFWCKDYIMFLVSKFSKPDLGLECWVFHFGSFWVLDSLMEFWCKELIFSDRGIKIQLCSWF